MRRFGAIFYGAEYKTKSAQIQQQLQQQQQQQQQSQRRLQKEQQSFDADNKPPQIKITRQITLDPSELDSNLVMRRSSNSMKTINTDVEFSNVMSYDNYETSKTDQDF
jgi:transcription initiation factor TFIID subunit TAF12